MIQGRFEILLRRGRTGARRNAFCLHEVGNDLRQPGVFFAGVDFLYHTVEAITFGFEGGQPGLCTAYIASKDHSIVLQWRPSRSMRSSASLGPHELAG